MDEVELGNHLETFNESQFETLRRNLKFKRAHFRFDATPSLRAGEIIDQFKQRGGDLSELVLAALAVVPRAEANLELRGEPPVQADPRGGVPHIHLLCDREEPVEAVRSFCDGSSNSCAPVLVLIILGDEEQAHDLLVERLRTFELRSVFRTGAEGEVRREERKIYPKSFAMPDNFVDQDQFKSDLEDKIRGDNFPRSPYRSLAQVAEGFHRRGDVVLLDTEMFYGDWKNRGKAKVEAFLEFFWKSWPPPSGDRRLVVCLNVRFDQDIPFNWLRGQFLVPQIFRDLEELSRRRTDILPPDRIFEIKGVDRDQARHWRKLEKVVAALRNFSDDSVMLEKKLVKLHRQSRGLFGGLAPMERLAGGLRTLVKDLVENNPRTRSRA